MSGDPVLWGELAWTELAERAGGVEAAILPVGATEAHGPHLPLNTDVIIAEEAGGRMTDVEGVTRIDAGHCITSNGLVHDEVMRVLRG